MPVNSSSSKPNMFSLAGWLFADMLLALAVLFLVIGAKNDVLSSRPPPTYTPYPTFTPATPAPTFTPYPTATPYPTFTPYPTYTAIPTLLPTSALGLDLELVTIYIAPNQRIKDRMESELKQYPGRRAGLVLAYGYDSTPSIGVQLAQNATARLQELFSNVFPSSMLARSYFWNPDATGIKGTIKLEIFFLHQFVSP